MTLSLFMIGGLILFLVKSDKVDDFKLIFGRLKLTTIGLIIVFASIIGIPPTAGFFSKMYLIKGAFQVGQYQFIIALLLSSLTSLFIFFRFFESYFYKKESESITASVKEPLLLTLPLMVTSIFIIGFGLTFSYWYQFILNIIPIGLR